MRGDCPGLIPGKKQPALFVHIPRTGGQSLVRALGCTQDTHLTAVNLRACVPESLWEESLRFSIVRNPWDHYVSWYLYAHGLGNPNDLAGEIPRFREWVKAGCHRWPCKWENPQCVDPLDQLGFVCDPGGELLVRVLFFPHLRQVYGFIVYRTGMPRRELPHIAKAVRLPFRDYYDDASRQIVAEQRASEIQRFDFTFEGHDD